MLCDICQEREANVFIKKIENNEKVEYNLCEVCAAKMTSPSIDLADFQQDFFSNLSDMLAGFVDIGKLEETEEKECPQCGITFSDFQQAGRLGCAECYDTFADRLAPLLQRLQGSIQHAGKAPVDIEKKTQIEKLRQELKEAVAREEYERAAVIRDRIRSLERKKTNK
jgi:protein arginine kinase activator